MNKEERIKLFKYLSRSERQELILRKMKAKVIKVGSVVLNKKNANSEVYELIQISNFFKELREN